MGISYHSCIGSNIDLPPLLPCTAPGNTSLNTPADNCANPHGKTLPDTCAKQPYLPDRLCAEPD